MTRTWKKFCTSEDCEVTEDVVLVAFANSRSHAVLVEERPDDYRITGVVARKAALQHRDPGEIRIDAWRTNRVSQLVGFHVDRYGRLLGEAYVPKVGLSEEEFMIYLRAVAAGCDRYEFILTGEDDE
jgi:hypothetical protein